MHRPLALSIAATAALALAACSPEANDPDERIVDTPDPNAVDVNLPATQPDYPLVPADARSTVDYTGDYTQTTADGRQRTITLGENDTYTMRDEEGAETSGTFNWYADNRRILIRRDGENEVYAVAEGALYRLPDENASVSGERTEEQTYRRAIGPGGPMPATGSPTTGQQNQPQQ